MSSPLPHKSNLLLHLSGGNYTAWQGKSGKLFGFSIGESTDDLHTFTKSSETGVDETTDTTALPHGIRQI